MMLLMYKPMPYCIFKDLQQPRFHVKHSSGVCHNDEQESQEESCSYGTTYAIPW